MKKLTLIYVFLILLTNTVINAGESLEKNTASTENNLSISAGTSIITHNGLFYRYFGSYSIANGVSLSYTELTDYLRRVPENKPYVRGAAVWDVLTLGFLGIDAGLLGGLTYCLVADNYKPTDRVVALYISSLAGCFLGFGAAEMARLNLTKAVNNYNLTVLGVPIR